MDEIRQVANNLVILENGSLVNNSDPDDFCRRIGHWIAEFPYRAPDPAQIPGLLHARQMDGQWHYKVLDQGPAFGEYLNRHGATTALQIGLELNDAVNGFLAKNHVSTVSAA